VTGKCTSAGEACRKASTGRKRVTQNKAKAGSTCAAVSSKLDVLAVEKRSEKTADVIAEDCVAELVGENAALKNKVLLSSECFTAWPSDMATEIFIVFISYESRTKVHNNE